MAKRIEGKHTEFMQLIAGNKARLLVNGTWETPGVEGVQEAAGTQSARIYVEKWQATMVQWLVLRPLFEVCARETGYKGWGEKEEGVVAPRVNIKTTLGHPGRLAGG